MFINNKNKVFININFKLIFLLSILLKSFNLNAQAVHDGILSSVGLGLNYSNFLYKRGIIVYPNYQILPLFSFFLINDEIELSPEAFTYTPYFYKNIIRLRSGLYRISDSAIYPVNLELQKTLPNRPIATEVFSRLEILLPNYLQYKAELDFRFSHSIQGFIGNYLELGSRIKLFEFELPSLPPIEIDFISTLGVGDDNYNKYFYGPDSSTSTTNNRTGFYEVGLIGTLPTSIDRYYPGLQIKYFEVLGPNKNAMYIKDGKNRGIYFTFSIGVDLIGVAKNKSLF